MAKKTRQSLRSRGKASRAISRTGASTSAAIVTRTSTSVIGGMPPTATFTNGKEQPQSRDSPNSMAHVRGPIAVSIFGLPSDIASLFVSDAIYAAKAGTTTRNLRDGGRT